MNRFDVRYIQLVEEKLLAIINKTTSGKDNLLWEVQAPSPDPNNKFASFERISHFVCISLCNGYTGADPEVTSSENGIRIRFEGGRNFQCLERVLEWLSDPKPYNC